ncbi:MAG: chromosomal replication initiator protein DnaA [Planctomycetes bacterium]|nr:chromosomal replication initiator protein DnaA [Planctomycetota bacterium]
MEACPVQSIWSEIQAALQNGFGGESSLIQRWLGMIRFLSQEGDTIHLGVPNRFVLEWIEKKYLVEIHEILRRSFNRGFIIKLRVDAGLFQELRRKQDGIIDPALRKEPPAAPAPAGVEAPARADSGGLAAGFNRAGYAHSLENFVTGVSNQTVFSAVSQVLGSPGKIFNPLFIHGPTGLGKTHLLQGLHYEFWRQKRNVRSRYFEGERFLNQFILSLKAGTIQRFREQIRSLDVFILDDFQLLVNKEKTQEEFLHTFDALFNSGSQLIIASTQPPRQLPSMKEALVSRLLSGLVVELKRPDYETRLAIIRHYARQASLPVGEDVLAVLAECARGNVREVLGALNLIGAHLKFAGGAAEGPLDLQKIRELLGSQFSGPQGRRLHLDQIVKAVGGYFQIAEEVLRSPNRGRSVSKARQVAIYLARRYTSHSLAEIGKFFSNRNFSTVRSAEANIRAQLEADLQLRQDIQEIQALLESREC